MRLLTLEEGMQLTDPHHDLWAEAHARAWKMWTRRLEKDPEFVGPLTATERYAILHRHICEYVARSVGEVLLPDKLGFFAQVIDGRALVRFKHLDSDLVPRSYPTETQANLDRQIYTDRLMGQLRIEGIEEPPTVLTVGYTLTLGEEDLSRVVVLCRNGMRLWSLDILGRGAGQSEELTPLPGQEPPGPRVISTRIPEEKERGSEGTEVLGS